MYWWVDVWSSDGFIFLGFLLCSYSPCQAAKQQTVVKPRCQAVKKSSSQAATVAHPSCQTARCKLQGQPAKQPSCTFAACTPCRPFLVMLHPSCNIHKHVGPLPGRSRPGSRPIQTRSRPQPAPIQTHNQLSLLKLVIVWFLSFLQTLGSQSIDFGTHANGSKSAYSQVESEVWTLNTIPGLAGIDLSTFPCDLWSSHRLM